MLLILRHLVALIVTAVALTCGAFDALADSRSPFYPTPEPHPESHKSGKLIQFYVGMKAGGGQLMVPGLSKPFAFNITRPYVINGTNIICLIPPRATATPPPGTCDLWPDGVVVGSTMVTVYYSDRENLSGRTVHLSSKMTAP